MFRLINYKSTLIRKGLCWIERPRRETIIDPEILSFKEIHAPLGEKCCEKIYQFGAG